MRILYIEDEPKMGRIVGRALEEAGFDSEIVADGKEGYAKARSGHYDLVIVDHLVPSMPGRDICKALRGEGHVMPLLMLTALNTLEDTVSGLDAGADDYITKPFEIDELLARVRALLRRRSPQAGVLRVDDLVLDTRTREVRRNAESIPLSDREFRLLEYLMRYAGKTIARGDIMTYVWGMSFSPKTNIVEVYINYLRRKIDTPSRPTVIKTVRGVGYRMG
jgi:DNA-binding response OmpR family regulator